MCKVRPHLVVRNLVVVLQASGHDLGEKMKMARSLKQMVIVCMCNLVGRCSWYVKSEPQSWQNHEKKALLSSRKDFVALDVSCAQALR
jgi:hypothetical protein